MSVLKKRDTPTTPPRVASSADGDEFAKRWPSVWEMLTVVQYSDGEPRRTSTFTVFTEDGVAKVCLNDRDNGLTGWSSGDGVVSALDALEAMLADDSVVWRAAGVALKGRKKRT